MRPRALATFLLIALGILCAGDLLAARGRGCGPHPCCTKGACKMMPKSGARFDKCGDEQASTPQVPPMILASVSATRDRQLPTANCQLTTVIVSDGASRNVDRPPRG